MRHAEFRSLWRQLGWRGRGQLVCERGVCEPGLLCLNGTCTAGKKLGQPCSVVDAGISDCFGLAECDPNTKVCTAPAHPTPGAPCGATTYLCQTGVCMIGADSVGVCPPVLAEGQACVPGGGTAVCDDYAVCATPQQIAGCCSSLGSSASSGGGSGGALGPTTSEDSGLQEDGAAPPMPTANPSPNEPTCIFFDPRTCK